MSEKQASTTRQSANASGKAISASNYATHVSEQYISPSTFNAFKTELERKALPEATDLDNGKILKVVNGEWVKAKAYTTEENSSGGITYIIGGCYEG
jgi:hypothetical protein